MNINLIGKRVLLIGATDVLGFACAEVLASEGCDLALVDTDIATLRAVTAELRSNHDISITSHAGDMTDKDWQKSVIEVVTPVDLVVVDWANFVLPHNVSTHSGTTFQHISLEDSKRILSLIGFCEEAMLAIQRRKGSGVLVSILGSLSYAALGKVQSLQDIDKRLWPMLQSMISSYTESISNKSEKTRSVVVNAEGRKSLSGDATEFELQVADTVAYLLSSVATPITSTTVDLYQDSDQVTK